jgi:hypothetical protein
MRREEKDMGALKLRASDYLQVDRQEVLGSALEFEMPVSLIQSRRG